MAPVEKAGNAYAHVVELGQVVGVGRAGATAARLKWVGKK